MKQKKVFALQKSSTPTGLIWDTNMADFSLFRYTNMADKTPRENALYTKRFHSSPTNHFSSSTCVRSLHTPPPPSGMLSYLRMKRKIKQERKRKNKRITNKQTKTTDRALKLHKLLIGNTNQIYSVVLMDGYGAQCKLSDFLVLWPNDISFSIPFVNDIFRSKRI